jgi:hypothetical protein
MEHRGQALPEHSDLYCALIVSGFPELLYPDEGGAGIYACGKADEGIGFSR